MSFSKRKTVIWSDRFRLCQMAEETVLDKIRVQGQHEFLAHQGGSLLVSSLGTFSSLLEVYKLAQSFFRSTRRALFRSVLFPMSSLCNCLEPAVSLPYDAIRIRVAVCIANNGMK
jgi:hypothetical protein